MYSPEFSKEILKAFKKTRKADAQLYKRAKEKMAEILEKPERYKPLRNVLRGCHRTHIGNFVLIFRIDFLNEKVEFIKFAHHDEAYR